MVSKSPQKKVGKKPPVTRTTAQKKPVASRSTPVAGDIQKTLDLHTKHLAQIDTTLNALKTELKEIKSAINAARTIPASPAGTAAKKGPDFSWHGLIDPAREYTQKEIIGITGISQPTLSMAKVRNHIITKPQPGKRGWVVTGSDLIAWDTARAKNAPKNLNRSAGSAPKKPAAKTSVGKPAAKSLAIEESSRTGRKVAVIAKGSKAVQAVKPSKPAAAPKPPAKKPVPAKTSATVKKPAAKKADSEIHAPVPADIPDRISALTMKKIVTQTQFGHDVGLPQKVIYEITTKKRKELNPEIIQKITATLKKYESR